MKILFLDFDGVLNNSATKEDYEDHTGIDPEKVALINKVLDATGAKVVISSDWRLYYSFEKLLEYLKQQGFMGEAIGVTQDFLGDRQKEIQEWLDTHPSVEKYAIVDDWYIFPKKPFVQTSPSAGITGKDANKLIELLK